MPELPEVEIIARQLRSFVSGKKIDSITVLRPSVLAKETPSTFSMRLARKHIRKVERRGKYLIFCLDGYKLIVHLRMTGKFLSYHTRPRENAHLRILFGFNDGSWLAYHDQRALGTLFTVQDKEVVPELEKLGVEPFDPNFTPKCLYQMIRQSRQPLKSFLLNQNRVVGLGNIYASEVLYNCGMHPERGSETLSRNEVKRLTDSIKRILAQAVEANGTTLSNYRDLLDQTGNFQTALKVYGREGERCERCGTEIKRIKQKGRSSYFCPQCQR